MADKELKKIWDNNKRIGEVMKTERTKVTVDLVARDGVKLINLRVWYLKRSANEWKPAFGEGLIIPVAIPIAGEVARPTDDLVWLIQQALFDAPAFTIEDKDNAVWN